MTDAHHVRLVKTSELAVAACYDRDSTFGAKHVLSGGFPYPKFDGVPFLCRSMFRCILRPWDCSWGSTCSSYKVSFLDEV